MTTQIRYAQPGDEAFWFRLDRHLSEAEFARKIRDRQAYLLLEGQAPAALLRYNLFWDNTPFCTLLSVAPERQRRGYGAQLMAHWEQDMQAQGYGMVLTSTQADESAQHFYRKLGYRDCGCLLVDVPGYAQPAELFFIKSTARRT